MLGSPALRLLLWLKLRARLRLQWRRLRTPKGALLSALGVLLFALWLGSLALSLLGSPGDVDPERAEPRVRAVALLLALLTFSSALAHRGLFLPHQEIERLFSAPLSRADLVRYRLCSSGLRSLLGGLFVALVSMWRLPSPPLACAGILLGMLTLPVLNQLVAIALGALENRMAEQLRRVGSALLVVLLLALTALVFALATGRSIEELPGLARWFALAGRSRGELLAHPWLAGLTLPLWPWARMIAADSLADFLPWFLLCLAVLVLLYELCARLPIDFRELSLATSASVAARINRARRGGGAASGRASSRAARWNVPWLFGRGPTGAIAWRKTAAIVRKAKAALYVGSVALVFLTLFAQIVLGSEELQGIPVPVLIPMMGTFYLCAGLRFDFREDLDRMEAIRAWPLSPARVFLATLVPEVVLVSALLIAVVLLQSLLADALHPLVLAIVPCLPLVVMAWVALDNAVFLFAPVRLVPGHEGTLQSAGRGLILMCFRGLLLCGMGFVCGGAGYAAGSLARNLLGWSAPSALGAGFLSFWGALFLLDCLLVWAGGEILRRFDVARDRG